SRSRRRPRRPSASPTTCRTNASTRSRRDGAGGSLRRRSSRPDPTARTRSPGSSSRRPAGRGAPGGRFGGCGVLRARARARGRGGGRGGGGGGPGGGGWARAAADARHTPGGGWGVAAWGVGGGPPPPADFVVADPSRAGLGKNVVRLVSETGARRLVLVSCDP